MTAGPSTHPWEKIAVFSFGVVFVSVLLLLVVLFPKLSPEAYTIFRIVIALAAAGIGAAIPGFLDVRMKGLLRASGAMALFVIVYFFSPPPPNTIRDPEPPPNPKEKAERAISEWFELIDRGAYSKAWTVTSDLTKTSYDEDAFLKVFESQRRPRGAVKSRTPRGLQSFVTLPNGRKGNFRLYTYLTVFASGEELAETLLLVAEDGKWKVLEHNLAVAPK